MGNAVLMLVPARAGSRRVPGKNLRRLAGIPLVGWAVRNAVRAARRLPGTGHRVVCSTDDPEIAQAARAWGAEVPALRPADLAGDSASSVDVALHALDGWKQRGEDFALLALVQPTSPLALPGDLLAAIDAAREAGSAVTAVQTAPADWMHGLDGRQLGAVLGEGPAVVPSGAAFVIAPERLRTGRSFVEPGRTRACLVPAERGLDIDTEEDLAVAAALLAARATAPFAIGKRSVGGPQPCFVVAEAGVNHDGVRERAHALVNAAADAGADAVKFQTWVTEKLCRPGAAKAAYQAAASGADEDQFAMLKRLELPYDWHAGLKEHAERRGLVFLSTPDDIDSARFLVGLGVPALKVGSGELTNVPLLRELARLGRPLILSTGMANVEEVGAALDAVDAVGPLPVALLHGVSAYPAPPAEMNLRAVATLRQAFGVPVGLTDHTQGDLAALAAVGMGASLLEKHLTLDRRSPGPDHAASAEPAELRELVRRLRAVEAAMGDGVKAPTASEADARRAVRRTLVYAADLPEGHVLGGGDVEALRTAEAGLPPAAADRIGGRRLARSVRGGEPVEEDDLA